MEVLDYAATIKPGMGALLHVSGLKWTNRKGITENVTVDGAPSVIPASAFPKLGEITSLNPLVSLMYLPAGNMAGQDWG